MLQVALSQLRTNSRRFIAIALAVVISVLFLSATLIADASLKQMLRSSFGQSYAKADLVIAPNFESGSIQEASGLSLADNDVQEMQKLPGVRQVHSLQYFDASFKTSEDRNVITQVLEVPPEEMNTYVTREGDLPSDGNHIAINNYLQEYYHINKDDTLTASVKGKARKFTVSGIVEGNTNPSLGNRPVVFGDHAVVSNVASGQHKDVQKIELKLDAGADEKATRAAAEEYFANRGILVNTVDEQVKTDLKDTASGTELMTSVLTLFAGIALIVAVLVISNTFTVLVAGRIRELALLRCIGASRNQIRNSVIIESLIVGFVSAAVGVLGAVGAVAAAVAYAKTLPSFGFATLEVPPQAIVAGLVAGTLITVVAAFNPAVKATRIAPLAALRPQENISLSSAKGKGMLATGAVIAILGAVLMVWGATADFEILARVSLAALGGISAFIGVLMCSRLVVPQAVKLVGRLSAALGTPGELARVNAVRNPARTSATATALLVGVTLVTVMITGAQGAKQSTDAFLNNLYPMDTIVSGRTSSEQLFTYQLAEKIESSVDNVKAAEYAPTGGKYIADTCVSVIGGVVVSMPSPKPAEASCYAVTMSQDAARRVLHEQKLNFSDDEILMPKNFKGQETVSVMGETGKKNLKVVKGNTDNLVPLITPATSAEIGGIAPTITISNSGELTSVPSAQLDMVNETLPHIWIAYEDGATDQQKDKADEEIARAASVDTAQITGVSMFKRLFGLIIDIILGLVSALLIISVFIALIGMGNTLSLSVLERTKENALLRALGLTKIQLRGMLTIESILIALVSSLLGIVLGAILGNFGIKAIFGNLMTIIIPWGPIAAVLIIAVIAGLVASLLPARRATRLSPVEGLAFE